MWAFLYEAGFWLTLSALMAWVFVARMTHWYRLLVWAFIIGSIAWSTSWLLGVWGLGFKLWVAARDLFVIGLALLAATFVKKAPQSYHWLAWLIVPLTFVFFHDNLKATFAERPQADADENWESGIPLDPNGELLVELREPADPGLLDDLSDRFSLHIRPAFAPAQPQLTHLDAWYLVDVPPQVEVAKVKEALSALKAVVWVEENERMQLAPIVVQPMATFKHNLVVNDPEASKQWGLSPIGVPRLYALLHKVQPQKKALIAILDSGVDARHEDIKGQYHSLAPRHDRDRLGHGTHCAGIAAAVTNNHIGIASPVPHPRFAALMSIKVLSDNGSGTQREIIAGIVQAVDAGADVINLSLGGPSTTARQRAYRQAVQYADARGTIIVAAAGNANRDARLFAPANVKGIIAVAAVDTTLHKASFSNSVAHLQMPLAAPGTAIYSTLPNNRYQALSGTSMAAPIVTSIVALMKSLHPQLTTSQAWEILHQTGRNTPDGNATGRLIQADKALAQLLE